MGLCPILKAEVLRVAVVVLAFSLGCSLGNRDQGARGAGITGDSSSLLFSVHQAGANMIGLSDRRSEIPWDLEQIHFHFLCLD